MPGDLLELWIAQSFERCYDASPRYRAYVDRLRTAESSAFDRAAPLLPSGVFKHCEIDRHLADGGALVTQSSGTMGTRSRVPRDDLTLMRLFGGLNAEVRRVLGLEGRSVPVGVVGTPPSTSEPTWLDYLTDTIGAAYDSYRLTTPSGDFDEGRIAAFIEAATGTADGSGCLVGPPALLLRLAGRLSGRTATLPPDTFVLAVGGWKTREGVVLSSTEVRAEIVNALSLEVDRFRDLYSMVELNTVLFECASFRKHVPGWLKVQVIDPVTGAVQAPGDRGVLGFWDPTAQSYPGFVLSDDIGLLRSDCDCLLAGPTIEIVRRVNRTEGRGCATKASLSGSLGP